MRCPCCGFVVLPETVDLTKMQRAVLDEVRRGYCVRDIGTRLFISPNTVKAHLRLIFVRLGVASRAELLSGLSGHSACKH